MLALLPRLITHFLAPALDGFEQRQAAFEVVDDGHPATALTIAATAPTAGHAPLAEQVAIEDGGVEACPPGERELDRLLNGHALFRQRHRDGDIPWRYAGNHRGSGPARGAFWPVPIHTVGVRCTASHAGAWAWLPQRQIALGRVRRKPAAGVR